MAVTVNVSVSPKSISVGPGESGQVAVNLRNTGQIVDQFTVSIDGLDSKWYSLPVSSVALFPNDEDQIKIMLQPPVQGATTGRFPFRLRVVSQENPGEPAIIDLSLDVQAALPVALVISQISAGRRSHYHLLATNAANRESILELKTESPYKKLKLTLSQKTLKVPASGRAEVEIEASFGWISLFFGKKQAEFHVVAQANGVADGQTITARAVAVRWYQLLPHWRLPWLSKPPSITSFNTATDDKREFRLRWSVEKASDIRLDGEIVPRQGGKTVRPSEARVYALSAANRNGTVTRTIELQPITVPPSRTSDRIKVTLSSSHAKAVAGGAPVPILLQVQNTGDVVDKFLVEVEGIDQAWYSRSASSIALMPQAVGQAQVQLQPPKQKPVRQGVYPFAVTVRSQIAQNEATTVLGQLEVLPLIEFKASVLPYRVTAGRTGKFRVSLANTGVSEVALGLATTDLDEGVHLRLKEASPVLPAWSTLEIPMVAKPRRFWLVGEKKQYDITLTARCTDGKSQTASCVLQHQPRLASWKPVIRTIRILIAVAAVLIAVFFLLRWGGGWETLSKSPQSFVDKFVKTVEGWFSR